MFEVEPKGMRWMALFIQSGDAKAGLNGTTDKAFEGGFAMVSLLLAMSLLGIVASMALPAWQQMSQRERESELIFRGEQYARAILLYQREQPGAYPPDIDTLVEGRFLRKRYGDPTMAEGEFRLVLQSDQDLSGGTGTTETGTEGVAEANRSVGEGRNENRTGDVQSGGVLGGIVGVASRNTDTSIKTYNGRTIYSEWEFVYTPDSLSVGQVGESDGTESAQEDVTLDSMGTSRGGRFGRVGRDADRGAGAR